jgi:hypothetical protein
MKQADKMKELTDMGLEIQRNGGALIPKSHDRGGGNSPRDPRGRRCRGLVQKQQLKGVAQPLI